MYACAGGIARHTCRARIETNCSGDPRLNTVRLAVRAVEAHSPFDRLRVNELKRTALIHVLHCSYDAACIINTKELSFKRLNADLAAAPKTHFD